MSLNKLKRLRDLWRDDQSIQAALDEAFGQIGFTEEYLQVCRAAVKSGVAVRKSKYIKDNIWGMVELDWKAVRLLDTPILQRLRSIKQLGFTSLTYPSAEHTRFIHSVGMAAVVEGFLSSIDKRALDAASDVSETFLGVSQLAPIKKDDLVHAALLHDVGHLPFSHASEFALMANPALFRCGESSIEDFMGEVARVKKDLTLSEAISLLIILSNRFQNYYDEFIRPGEEDPDALLRVACLIAGLPPQDRLSGVAELISSGAIDADKVDYINRDARACGIPIGVDVARVFLRSSFLEVDRKRMIEADLKEDPAEREILFIVNASGIDTLDEITQARAALYQRVYLHPVTRAAEVMLSRALEANARRSGDHKGSPLRSALFLWSRTDGDLLSDLANLPAVDGGHYGQALKIRRLPKKACVFSASIAEMHMPLKRLLYDVDKTKADQLRKLVVNTPLEALDAKNLGRGESLKIEQKISQEAKELAERFRSAGASDLVPQAPLNCVVLVGTAYMDRTRKECIVLQNGELLKTSTFTNVRETQDALEIFKAVGFVMSDPEWAPIIAIAARTILARSSGVLMPAELDFTKSASKPIKIQERMILNLRGLYRRSGVRRENLEKVVNAATDTGYFDDKPFLAPREDPEAERNRELASLFSTFDGEGSWRVRPETVAAFLDQFPPRLRDSMAEALQGMVFFTASEIARSLKERLRLIEGGADVVGLTPNSGTAVMTALRRVAREDDQMARFRLATELREALEKDTDEPIVFVDDNASSGVQASAQLLSLAGVPRDQWPEECRTEDAIFNTGLEGDRLARLRKRPVHLIVCAGGAAAEARIKTAADRGGFQFAGLAFKHSIEEKISWPEPLRLFLQEVGTSLIAWTRYGKAPADLSKDERQSCEKDAFGYGNAGGLLATATNVPTSTVTAIWSPGMHRGAPWMPLMIRQNKLRHLIIA